MIQFLGHLGSATWQPCLIAALVEVTIPFKGTLFLGALLDGAIMGYLVNRKIRDITPYLVSIIPLAWLAYGEALQPPILEFGRTNPSLHSFRYVFASIIQYLR